MGVIDLLLEQQNTRRRYVLKPLDKKFTVVCDENTKFFLCASTSKPFSEDQKQS